MIEVRVAGVAVDATGQHVVLLGPVADGAGGARVLPIWIGAQEAMSILIGLEGSAPRPLSHDLMRSLIDAVGADVDRVDVTRLDAGTYYAEITLRTGADRRVLDARPSDAIALAVRARAPIGVHEAVFGEGSIPAPSAEPGNDDEETKLSEFKEFLDAVDPEDFRG